MKRLLPFILFASTLFSCTKDQETPIAVDPCDTMNVTYTLHVEPFVRTYCITGTGPGTGCHDAWILDYNGVKGVVDNGKFLDVIWVKETMPPIPNNFNIVPPTSAEVERIKCWIEAGGPNN